MTIPFTSGLLSMEETADSQSRIPDSEAAVPNIGDFFSPDQGFGPGFEQSEESPDHCYESSQFKRTIIVIR
jgi:hypothetical protein